MTTLYAHPPCRGPLYPEPDGRAWCARCCAVVRVHPGDAVGVYDATARAVAVYAPHPRADGAPCA